MKKINHQFKEFYNKGLNDSEISKILQCNNATVSIWRKQNNLPSNYKINNENKKKLKKLKKENKYQIINDSIKSRIIGTLLGDSSINKQNTFSFTHQLKQKDYLIWKTNNISLSVKITDRIYITNNKEFPSICASFHSHPFFKELRNAFYPNGKKIFNYEYCLKYLNWEAFAYWFGDDGNKLKSGGLQISIHALKDNIDDIKKVLYNNLKLLPTIHSDNVLYFDKKQSNYIRENIKQYLPECLLYKLCSH